MPSDSTLPFSVAHGHAVALRTYARNVERGTVPTDTMSPSKVARLADEIAAAVEDMRDLAAEHEREVRAALQARIDAVRAVVDSHEGDAPGSPMYPLWRAVRAAAYGDTTEAGR